MENSNLTFAVRFTGSIRNNQAAAILFKDGKELATYHQVEAEVKTDFIERVRKMISEDHKEVTALEVSPWKSKKENWDFTPVSAEPKQPKQPKVSAAAQKIQMIGEATISFNIDTRTITIEHDNKTTELETHQLDFRQGWVQALEDRLILEHSVKVCRGSLNIAPLEDFPTDRANKHGLWRLTREFEGLRQKQKNAKRRERLEALIQAEEKVKAEKLEKSMEPSNPTKKSKKAGLPKAPNNHKAPKAKKNTPAGSAYETVETPAGPVQVLAK